MNRRFLTAEDVRRHEGNQLSVDEQTLVTYQAREEAERRGIAIVTPTGAYAEPAPDRGPDAATAAAHLPHLPEPSDSTLPTEVVVTAVGRNRTGVLAELTVTLGEAGADVHDITQRVVDGWFHTILVVSLAPDRSFHELKSRLECLGGPDDYIVRVMHERVFRYMHRV